ncbi:MerR family transcriptional regulator [Bacillus thuringiensis]|uniref:MerR family transcriptional regulator n=1 Tax=Bacillus thuringiensis TaxID=1428 RepID=UPI0028C37914|nr:MerR family transcriptional regulator [Bacillus thuringiensis]
MDASHSILQKFSLLSKTLQQNLTEFTGLSNDLLRTYEEEFNLDISKTSGGHRRYIEKDINTFVSIKQKVQEHQVVSNLEKKLEQQTTLIQDLNEKLEKSIMLQMEMVKQMQELKQEKKQLEQIVENRNQDLINTLIEEKRKDREEREIKKTLFQRLFGR